MSINLIQALEMLDHIHQPFCVQIGLGVANLKSSVNNDDGKIEQGFTRPHILLDLILEFLDPAYLYKSVM